MLKGKKLLNSQINFPQALFSSTVNQHYHRRGYVLVNPGLRTFPPDELQASLTLILHYEMPIYCMVNLKKFDVLLQIARDQRHVRKLF